MDGEPSDTQMSKDPALGISELAGGMCTKMTSQMEMCGGKISDQIGKMSLPTANGNGLSGPMPDGSNLSEATTPSFFGDMTKWFSDMFGGIWKLAQNFGSGFMGMLGGVGKFLTESFSKIVEGAGDLLKSIGSLFSGSSGKTLFEGASTVVGAIGAFFKEGGLAQAPITLPQFATGGLPRFATGKPESFMGKIHGFGTGTSDSILALVGNGEYIVKESKTKKHRKLLDAINFGSDDLIPKFAGGGVGGVLDTGMKVISDSASSNKKTGNTTILNWTITGDISRQTRNEIQRMIPQIASGVNAHNVENNYRR